MRDLTDYELHQITAELIEKACTILSEAAEMTDELTTILASICVNEDCAQLAEQLSQTDAETSLKPI